MKLTISILVGFLVCATPVSAGYDHVIEAGHIGGLTLDEKESLLMTGGGCMI